MKSIDNGPLGRAECQSNGDSTVQVGIFTSTGDYWTIGYAGVNFSLRDSIGLSYVQRLLQNPGEEFHARDLMMGGTLSVHGAERPDEDALRGADLTRSWPNDL